MYYSKFTELGRKINKKIISILPQAYVPIPNRIEKMGNLILENLD
ncbi:MAG: hypothetical protein E7B46_15660 [Clostridium perfringens]|nr:hypothetical protein [Clostridium perfringens]